MRQAGIWTVMLLSAGCSQQPSQTPAATRDDLCVESAELGRTIAVAAKTPDEARAVTEHAIASNKYPTLGNKVVASVGGVVILGTAAGMTPDEIHNRLLSECRGGSSR